MNLSLNTIMWGAAAAAGVYYGRKQRGLFKYAALGIGAYAGVRAVNAATGSNILGLSGIRGLAGATVSYEQPSMFNGTPVYIQG